MSVFGATRLRAGLLRDVLWIIAIAQGIVVVIPLVVTARWSRRSRWACC